MSDQLSLDDDMSTTPLLPSHINEKTESPTTGPIDAADETTLRVGRPTFATRAKERWSGLTRPKKILVAGAAFWLTAGAAHKAIHHLHHHGRHHKNDWHGFHSDEDWDGHRPWDGFKGESTITPATYNTALELSSSSLLTGSDVYQTANATFELSSATSAGRGRRHGKHGKHRQLALDFQPGTAGRVVVSRNPDEAQVSPLLIVESTWAGLEALNASVKLASARKWDQLTVESSAVAAHHTLHLVLPQRAKHVQSLHLNSASSLELALHPSASDISFKHLSAHATDSVILPDIEGKFVHIETVDGSVGGTFNVSHLLVLKSITADIKANITVFPAFPPPHHKWNHTHHGNHSIEFAGDDERKHFSHHDLKPHHEEELEGVEGHHRPHHGSKNHPEDESDDEFKPKSDDRQHDDDDEELEHRRHEHLESHNKKAEGKNEKKHAKAEGEKKRSGCHGMQRKSRAAGLSKWWPFSMFASSADGSSPSSSDGKKGRKPHSPPKPAIIIAKSLSGSIDLFVRQPPFVSSVIKAFSHTGKVFVHGPRTFKGFFKAGTFVGDVEVHAGPKHIKYLKQIEGEKGQLVEGLVFPPFNMTHPPHHHNESEIDVADEKEDKHGHKHRHAHLLDNAELKAVFDEVVAFFEKHKELDNDNEDENRHWGKRFFGFDEPEGTMDFADFFPEGPEAGPDGPAPPPPHDGPGGPPPSSPHGPPAPPHDGPGSPSHPPHGPPPPHKGPGGPPPHKGHGRRPSHGPPHHPRIPFPGFSKVIAHTDVGDVVLVL